MEILNKNNFFEAMIVFSIMTGVLLPVRLFFVTYVSDNWLGSFGLVSIISLAMIILTKKGKLGKFGEMFERQLNKLQHGKRAKIVYGQSIFFLIVLGGTIFAIEQGNSTYVEYKEELISQHAEFSDPELILAKAEEITIQDWIYGFVGMFLAIFFAFPQLAAVFAVLNESSHGWIMHFYTVAFVEYIELFGILLLYRFSLQKNSTIPSKEETFDEIN
jgi:hypothetical protein